MQLPKKETLSFLFFFFSLFIHAQTVKNFTLADGLPGNAIKCLFKDSRGLMWIGTETGLCTYDGIRFKIIGQEQGLKHNLIWKITEDSKKNIWLSLYGNGVAKFNGVKFTYYNKKQGLVNDAVRSMYFSEKDNCMVFGTEDGLSLFDGKNFKNFDFQLYNTTKNFQVNFISEYNDKIIAGVNQEYLYELRIDKVQINKSSLIKYKNPKTLNYSGFIDRDNFYNRNFLNEFEVQNLKTNQKQKFGVCPIIWDYTKDINNSIFMACWEVNTPSGGILKFANNKLTDISKEFNLPTSQYWCLYYDTKTEQLWVGSIDKGLIVIDFSKKITYYNSEIASENSEINSILIDDNQNIWCGANNFISKKTSNSLKVIDNESIVNQILFQIKNRFDPINNWLKIFLKKSKNFKCTAIKQDEFGTIWAMTNYGLIALNNDLKIIKFQYLLETGGVFDFIDSKNILLSQKYNFGYSISPQNLEQHKKILYKGKPIGLDASKIYKGKNGLWIASNTIGLLLFEKGDLKSMNDLGFLSDKNFTEVIVDDLQNIISGTVNGKIYFSKWENHKLNHLKVLLPDEEIIGNTIFFIRQYGSYFFVGTNRGITILKNFRRLKFIDGEEGLQLSRYSDAQIDNKRKILWVACDNGLFSLDIVKILKEQKVNSPIHINQIKINQKEVKVSPELFLNHNENNLEIYFNSNNIYNSKKNFYRYKINGLSESWSSYSTDNNIKLYGLKSGKYQIFIEGKNIGTNEIIEPAKMNITIYPPFWQTVWFIGIIVLVFIVLTILYVKNKIKVIKYKVDLERRIAETKLQALQSQMNPHFVFNAMNSIQNFVIDNKTDDALWYMSEFSKMMRQTLDFSTKSTICLEEEIDYLKRYIILENLRRKHKVAFSLTIEENLDIQEIQLPPMLIEPIVENVFVHAFDNSIKDGKLNINFSLVKDKLICTIVDNGKGYNPQGKSSKGLKLIQERLKLLKTESSNILSIKKEDEGTNVQIQIALR